MGLYRIKQQYVTRSILLLDKQSQSLKQSADFPSQHIPQVLPTRDLILSTRSAMALMLLVFLPQKAHSEFMIFHFLSQICIVLPGGWHNCLDCFFNKYFAHTLSEASTALLQMYISWRIRLWAILLVNPFLRTNKYSITNIFNLGTYINRHCSRCLFDGIPRRCRCHYLQYQYDIWWV